MLTKEECEKALDCLSDDDKMDELAQKFSMDDDYTSNVNYEMARKWCYDQLKQCIDEHFDNQPLKFEELEEGMWVWDNKHKVYNQIYRLYGNFMSTKHNAVQFKHLNETTQWGDTIEFEKKRFYRKEVQE